MQRFKKVFRTIVIVVALSLGAVITCIDVMGQEDIVRRFYNPSTTEEYEILKEYADTYTETLGAEITDKDTKISHEWKENYLIVTAEDEICRVIATYPIELKPNLDDGGYVRGLLYEEATYEEESKMPSVIASIIAIFMAFWIYCLLIYAVLYYPVIFVIMLISYIKEKSKK